MRNQKLAYLLTILTITFWATAASAFKIALRYVTPYTLLLYSILFSATALLIILCFQGKLGQLKLGGMRALVQGALLGFLNPFLYYVVLFKAYAILPGQVAMALNYGWPLVLTILSVPILKQSLSKSQLLAVSISFVGAVIIATRGEFTRFGDVSIFGVFLAGGSTIIWACFWLFNAKDGQDPVVKLFTCFCFGLLYAFGFNVFSGDISIPKPVAIPALVYIGLFEMSITFVLWLTALKLTRTAARLGNFIYVTPFLSLLLLHLIIGEKIHAATFIGLILIIGSILFQGYQFREVKPNVKQNRGGRIGVESS